MKWVTRERPVIDRIACPWLIARFIDKGAEFLFVPPDRVLSVAKETGATPTMCLAWNSAMSVKDAASMRSFRSMASIGIQQSRRLLRSCAGPTPAATILRPNRPGCWRSQWVCET